MTEGNDKEYISSIDILEKTGISRATLNNYIKLGILPKPIIRKPRDLKTKAKQIGYFPREVLDRISMVQLMKIEGHRIETIARKLKDTSLGEPSAGKNERAIPERRKGGNVRESERGELKLTIDEISCPAYLVNNEFEIDWINDEAETCIFGQRIGQIKEADSRNIFKLFRDMGMYSDDSGMAHLVDFHMSFVKPKIQRSEIGKLYEGMSQKEISICENVYDRVAVIPKVSIYETYLNLYRCAGPYHVYGIFFREGVLFIFAPVEGMLQNISEILSNRAKVVSDLLSKRLPSLISFTVLVADLQDSKRICAELPPEEYFELINQLWKLAEDSFKKYYGIYGKHSCDGMVYYFLKNKDTNYIMNAVYCSIELREKVKRLDMEWKMKKGWLNEIYLNIGINEGQEYFGAIPTSPNIEYTVLGDSVNYAGSISEFARYGSIWTTKNLMNKMTPDELKKIRYGIRKKDKDREIFIENVFSRVMDMLRLDDPVYKKYQDIGTLPVTEIIGITEDSNQISATFQN